MLFLKKFSMRTVFYWLLSSPCVLFLEKVDLEMCNQHHGFWWPQDNCLLSLPALGASCFLLFPIHSVPHPSDHSNSCPKGYQIQEEWLWHMIEPASLSPGHGTCTFLSCSLLSPSIQSRGFTGLFVLLMSSDCKDTQQYPPPEMLPLPTERGMKC